MTCPFLQRAAVEDIPAVCPHGKATSDIQTDAPSCPLGFGSSKTRLPSPLHCSICRGLLHDCVRVNACGHKFCRFCISNFKDCPICGVDVDGVTLDTDTNGAHCRNMRSCPTSLTPRMHAARTELIEKFYDIHAGNPSLWTKVVRLCVMVDPPVYNLWPTSKRRVLAPGGDPSGGPRCY
jgi:hypothetical protein